MRQDFIDFCKEFATEHLDYMVDNTYCVSELCTYFITDGVSQNPAYELDIKDDVEALKWLEDWIIPAEKYLEYERFHFGEHLHNPSDEPVAVLACMIIEGVIGILQRCETITDSWNDEVEVTQEFVDKIKAEIAALPEDVEVF